MKKLFIVILSVLLLAGFAFAAIDEWLGVGSINDFFGAGNMSKLAGVDVAAGITTPVYNATAGFITDATGWDSTLTLTINTQDVSNRCFVAVFQFQDSRTVSTLTFNSVDVTTDPPSGSTGMAELNTGPTGAMAYYCDDGSPDWTGNKDMVITVDSNSPIAGWLIEIDGVNGTSPIADWVELEEDGATYDITLSLDTTGQDNCLIVSGAITRLTPLEDYVVCDGTGQTKLGEVELGATDYFTGVGGYFAHDTAGAKDQCWEIATQWKPITGFAIAFKPAGS